MTDQDKLSILLDNLRLCDTRSACDAEQRCIMLSEIARHLCELSQDEDISEIVARFCELTDSTSLADGIAICSALASETRLLEALRYTVSVGHEESTPAGSHGKVAFTKNKYNEIAFEQLSKKIIGAKAHYTASLSDACEAVNDGECEFCIIPVRNSHDGRLWGFYSLLDRYGLKICSVCSVESIDSISSTDYALVGKYSPEPSKRQSADLPLIFEFSVLAEDGEFLTDLLSVARMCHATLLYIDSRPVEYDMQSCRYILSFYLKASDSLLLRCLLATYYDSYSPIGLYQKN
jgi:hypothetical protein